MISRLAAAIAVSIPFIAFTLGADCVGPRWPVKVARDPDAELINTALLPTSIAALRAFPTSRPLPQDRRLKPVETTTYALTATLVEYRLDEDGNHHLVLSDETGRTVIARIPAPACVNGSRFAAEIAGARQVFEARFHADAVLRQTATAVEIRGIGFFEYFGDQRGMAPNAIELHPVTFLSFTPLVAPVPPPARPARRRAVTPAPVTPVCHVPALTMSTTKTSACSGESVTLNWQASDPAARVTIDGIGSALPATGSTTVSSAVSSAWSGHATNSCGTGSEAVVVITIQAPASISLFGPATLQRGNSATLSFFLSTTLSWTLTSSLRNPISPSFGTGSGNLSSTYTATSTGTDTVSLGATGGACGSLLRTINISVTEPQNAGLLCCDGTRSPTCFSCSNKQGCCSGHRGVCGCP